MISIIICSRTKAISFNLSKNIEKTICCNYELIVIDNSQNQFSIFEAYNLGIKNSHGEYLCFIHDDILFHTMGWGSVINRVFKENNEIGLIGIAGSKMKTRMPSTWSDCEEHFKVFNIIQHYKNGKAELQSKGFSNHNKHETVVAIDGVFMAGRKNSLIRFNEKIKGFHNYDLNISFEYFIHNYKIIVTKEILIEHFSIGTINKSWYKSSLTLYSLYSKYLPLIGKTNNLFYEDIIKREVINGSSFVMQLFSHNYYLQGLIFWFKLLKIKPFTLYHYIIIKTFFKNDS